jgi:OmpA-OmpF porin, OOP family
MTRQAFHFLGRACWVGALGLSLAAVLIQTAQAQSTQQGTQTPQRTASPIVVTGTVASEAVRAEIVSKLKSLYAPQEVIDQLKVGDVAAPPEWGARVVQLLTPNLKQVSKGQLSMVGNSVEVVGQIASETQHQQLSAEMRKSLPSHYTVKDALQVAAQEQNLLDQTLANRIIEFESNKATLKPTGKAILDEMAAALLKIGGKKVELIGHTDAQGRPASNLALSQARAQAVRLYLIEKGVAPALLSATGVGASNPIAANDTEDGRARNRRIEFRISQ